ncbi:MAG: RNA-binding cell elongation regulator Jag/EloR, partial [Lachnospiraceae bacterium]|nr:RNA-binding cell elongation regulator Jag/EloR [Lachnospiraceae bacterium]
EYKEFSAKTVDDAITAACQDFFVTSDKLDYEVLEEGSSGFLGIGAKPALIKARVKEDKEIVKESVKEPVKEVLKEEKKSVKETAKVSSVDAREVEEAAKKFLGEVFDAMEMEVIVDARYDDAEKALDVDMRGEEIGILIGKRGQTLDSLQYLVSLVVNRGQADYIRVKLDTENYRQRRKETLENLAKNIAYKVKRTKRPVSLEPMNPYERRIIHSALQNDRYVTTHSEGEEPFRRVVVSLKK